MREIRELQESELPEMIRISSEAYTAYGRFSVEAQAAGVEKMKERLKDEHISCWGLFDAGDLHGVMVLYDYQMRLWSGETAVGGIGGVAVDLLHKKERVAYELLQFFLRWCKENDKPIAALYTFRPDFYKKMGFAFGSKMNRYAIAPAALPRGKKDSVTFLSAADEAAMRGCYLRYRAQTQGLFLRLDGEYAGLFKSEEMQVVGHWQDGELTGYMIYSFKRNSEATFLSNNMEVVELVYETAVSLRQLLAFLHSQADQIERVILDSQDDQFHHLLSDPRNGEIGLIGGIGHQTNAQAVSIMYRVTDPVLLFDSLRDRDFNGESCKLRLVVEDSFLADSVTVLWFENGRLSLPVNSDYDVELHLTISDLAAIVMGIVPFATMHDYGLAHLSDDRFVLLLDRLFAGKRPLCMTLF